MKILILGGAGFLGNNLARHCLKVKNNKITLVDSLEPSLKSNLDNLKDILPSVKFIQGDIRNSLLMDDVVKDKDVIFNCAAQSSHPNSIKNPFLDVQINCLGNITVLEAIKNNNNKALVVFTSSSSSIGPALVNEIDENHRELPLDIYSANKGVAEKYYYIYNKVHGLKTLALRFANLYGPYGKSDPEFGFINYFINLAAQGKEITIYGDGKQVRNVTYVEDAVDIMYTSISHRDLWGDIYFAVSREHYPVIGIAKKIVSVFKKGSVVKIPWPDVRKKMEIGKVVFNGKKLSDKIGWEAKYSLRKGLVKTKKIMDKYN